jgi:pyrrolysyl-tRNA synthetase-like protein
VGVAAPSSPLSPPSASAQPAVEIVRPVKKRAVRRHSDPYAIVDKIKLWPSKTGVLHGVRSVKLKGGLIEVHTHCGQSARVRNSRSGRLARHLRNKTFEKPCPRCRIPAWKIAKFEETAFI